MKNAHGEVLFKLQASALLKKKTLLHGCFSRFLNCTNGTKSRKASHILRLVNFNVFYDKVL